MTIKGRVENHLFVFLRRMMMMMMMKYTYILFLMTNDDRYTDRILFQNYDDERLVRLFIYEYVTYQYNRVIIALLIKQSIRYNPIPIHSFIHSYATVETIHDSDHTPVFGAVCLRIGANAEQGPTDQQVHSS